LGPDSLTPFRFLSLNMQHFFVLAGFLLGKATTRPIEDRRKFFRGRIMASHPLYLLAVLTMVPNTLYIQWPTSLASLPGFFFDLAWKLVLSFYGEPFFLNQVFWFSTTYNFCIFIFPWLHSAMGSWRIFNCGRFMFLHQLLICLISYAILLATDLSAELFYMTHPHVIGGDPMENPEASWALYWYINTHNVFIWPLWFFCGILTFKLFEYYRRGLTTGGQVWGWITDLLGLAGILSNFYLAWQPRESTDPFFRWYRLVSGVCIIIWQYGLATGQGITATVFGSSFLADTLSPAAYAVYMFHGQVALWWNIVSRSVMYPFTGVGPDLDHQFNWGVARGQNTMSWLELAFVTPLIWWFAWYVTMHWSEKLSVRFQQIFDRGYCWCCCLCSGVGILCWKPEDVGAETDTMLTVLDSISSLTGADADATSKLTEIGLDSFGAGGLVGLLVSRLPGLVLRAVDLYEVDTVGDLVKLIDSKLSEVQAKMDV